MKILPVLILMMGAGCTTQSPRVSGDVVKEITVADTIKLYQDDPMLSLKNGITQFNGSLVTAVVIILYVNGDTASRTSYYNGKTEGEQIMWYNNGQVSEERYYKAGKKEGIHKAWYEDGKQRFVYNFKNGEYEGELKEWYPNGQMYKDFNYVNGYESGMQTAWETSGKLLANYEVKNGRKYGLIGTHNCKSLWGDEPKGDKNENSM